MEAKINFSGEMRRTVGRNEYKTARGVETKYVSMQSKTPLHP